ncbi:endonuclease/exonuclease/phosphatase family protein [Mucilaginibacter sp. Bleaf8]|uniref:endonuclease/exonuclease/phosphatase family protein n=1 Tax=Mucilaginibacter sp. Bleaf8 TaxID=2834430 RepID=UPI001BCC41CF|nr:endonuclease/exonuclease/phosphatase family protein [Mucilaginibacter sp. Bleaf8]MBS7566637.1 endonuclease/exonuclease/phosphatase family protein [Mucilaginibacter sp. Bleaf8]
MKGKNTKLNFFDKLFWWLTILAGLSLLISYLSPIIDPRKIWIVAFFGLAYPFLLLANVLLLIFWVFRGKRYWLMPTLIIIIGFNVLFDNIGFRFFEPPRNVVKENCLRVMTYNVHNFKGYGDKNNPNTKTEALSIIAAEHPDVVGMQEYFTRKRGQYAFTDSMKRLMRSNHYYFEPFNYDRSYEAVGLAIFSKYPIVNKGYIRLSDEGGSGNQCVYTDIKKGNHIVRIYSIHLQSIRFDPTDYDYLDSVSRHGKTSLSSSKRIGSKLKRAFIKRSEQVFKVKEHAAQCPYPYVISGDFNDTPASFAVNQMAKGLKNAFREKGSGMGRTYNGSFPNYQIDYIMASPKLDVDNYWIVKKKMSDHYPVCSDLMLK